MTGSPESVRPRANSVAKAEPPTISTPTGPAAERPRTRDSGPMVKP